MENVGWLAELYVSYRMNMMVSYRALKYTRYKCFSCVTLGKLFYLSVYEYIKDDKSTCLIGSGED